MATIAARFAGREPGPDVLSGTPRAHAVDRWIYVFTAASFIVITLTGFIPDSLMKIEMVRTGARPPFPLVLHMHALLMGSFLLLLLAQTVLVATGRVDLHRRLGLLGMVIAPALVVVGIVLVPTIYHSVWNAAQTASPDVKPELQQLVLRLDKIMLLQLRIGILFPLLLFIALRSRGKNAGVHKRMMILATAIALPAAFDRITWLPTTFPDSPIGPDLYVLLAVAPMFIWDVVRNRRIHEAYLIWFAVALPFTIVVHALWGTPWWEATAPRLMGV